MSKRKTLKKVLSVCLAVALVVTTIPFSISGAKAAGNGSSYASAEDIQVNQNKTITFYDSKNDYFCKFTIPQQGVVNFKSEDKNITKEAFGFQYILYDKDGKIIWGGKKDTKSMNPKYSGSVGLAAGTYTLKIDPAYFSRETRTIDFIANFSPNQYCEIESNELIADATPMELGHFYEIYFGGQSSAAGTGENDYFKFKAEKNKFYRATITNFDVVDPTTILFNVYNPNGDPEGSLRFNTKVDKNGNYYYDFQAKMTGEYKIRVYNYHQEQVGFKLKMAKAPFYPTMPDYYKLNANLSTAKGGYDDVHLSWDKVDGATGYEIYMKKGSAKKYTLKAKTTKLYYNARNLTDGARYYFKMRPYYSDGNKIYKKNAYKFANIWTMKKVSTPTVKRTSKYNANYVDLNWKKVNGDICYQISRSTSKTGTNIVVASVYTNKYTYLSCKANRGYYYKVRACYKAYANGKNITVYAPWSNVKYYKTTK